MEALTGLMLEMGMDMLVLSASLAPTVKPGAQALNFENKLQIAILF